ncbi:4089_t:CDS:2 [Entrophospora sp. SA101]|nr:4089_t:CDS:2 [Entrophospora sp. SA101]
MKLYANLIEAYTYHRSTNDVLKDDKFNTNQVKEFAWVIFEHIRLEVCEPDEKTCNLMGFDSVQGMKEH